MDKSVFWFSSALFFDGSKDAGIIQDISFRRINWELTLPFFIHHTFLLYDYFDDIALRSIGNAVPITGEHYYWITILQL